MFLFLRVTPLMFTEPFGAYSSVRRKREYTELENCSFIQEELNQTS
jgi:hypothetical protein